MRQDHRQDAHLILGSGHFRKINPRKDYDFAQMLEMMKPGEVDIPYDRLVWRLALCRSRAPDLFSVQSEFLSLLMATRTNDEIKQDDAGLFTYDPIR